ncbi:MAG: dTMP kinase [Planctomycetaceae bacterium]
MPGRFIVFEGPDGAGKTTQAARLARRREERGEEVLLVREPGGTPAGEAIRDLILAPETDLVPLTEMLLYQAARAQLVTAVLRPALESGKTVILDRYAYSTLAYQGYGLRLAIEEVRAVTRVSTGGLEPERVLFLDLPPEIGLHRVTGARDRIESRPLDYHRRVREGFLAEARRLGARAVVLDATASADHLAAEIDRLLERT